jgi:CRISPR-associated protein Csb2
VDIRMTGYGAASSVLPDLAGCARTWTSATPYVPPRHAKREWDEFVRSDVRRELTHRGIAAPVTVEVTDGDWASFIRYRPSKRFDPRRPDRRSAPRGGFLTLTFDSPEPGPLALGYLSHFGLGLFVPDGR